MSYAMRTDNASCMDGLVLRLAVVLAWMLPAGEVVAAESRAGLVYTEAVAGAAGNHAAHSSAGVAGAGLWQDVVADAYLDEQAREMVRLARLRRQSIDRSIAAYQALAQERVSTGVGLGLQERLLFRSEVAASVEWRKGGPVNVEMLGARQVAPLFSARRWVPEDLRWSMPRLAYDPVDSQLLVASQDSPLRNPLAEGSEVHYRFAAGDVAAITLPDGRELRVQELHILPRRAAPDLISGSYWLDLDTHSVVRAVYRLAQGLATPVPLLGEARADLEYFTVEYGFWDLRWWLPRYVSASGMVQLGPLRVPIHYELLYSEYEIQGDVAAPARPATEQPEQSCRRPLQVRLVSLPGVTPDTAAERRRMEQDSAYHVRAMRNDSTQRAQRASADSVAAVRQARALGETDAEVLAEEGRTAAEAARAAWRGLCDWDFVISLPEQEQLLESQWLPESVFQAGPVLTSEMELRAVADRLKQAAKAPWRLTRPSLRWGMGRYNRVEGQSLGVQAKLDLGRLLVDGTVRLGHADLTPQVELGLRRETRLGELRLAGFRRLVAEPTSRGFSPGNSVNALLFGRDDGDYYHAFGLELVGGPPAGSRQWYDWQIRAERQAPAPVATQFSLRRNLFDRDHGFRDNIVADSADQLGGTLRLRTWRGLDPHAFRWGAELVLDAGTGTFHFVRPGLILSARTPLTSRLVGSLEAAAGSSLGHLPAQSRWFLGGPASLRGYAPATLTGDAFWRGRAGIGTGATAARLEVFGDLGWAGDRAHFHSATPLRSVGIGLTFLDSMLRLDVARALRPPEGWRLDFHLDR